MLSSAQMTELGPQGDPRSKFPFGGEEKLCFVTLSGSVGGNAVRCLLQCRVDEQSVSLGYVP